MPCLHQELSVVFLVHISHLNSESCPRVWHIIDTPKGYVYVTLINL